MHAQQFTGYKNIPEHNYITRKLFGVTPLLVQDSVACSTTFRLYYKNLKTIKILYRKFYLRSPNLCKFCEESQASKF